MKTFKKVMIVLMAVFALTVMTKAPVSASTTFEVSSVNNKTNYIGLKWNAPTFDSTYWTFKVTGYRIYNSQNLDTPIASLGADTYSYNVTGLKKGYFGYFYVYCDYYYTNGSSLYTGSTYDSTCAATMPANVTTYYIGYLNNKSVSYSVKCPTNASGVQVDQYNAYTKKHTYKKCYSYANDFTAPYGVGIRYRARAYYHNSSTNKDYYGSWSAWKTYANINLSGGSTSKKKGITLKFPATKQISKYVITVATSQNGKYKKTVTVPASSKAKTYLLKKIGTAKMKKSTRYYFKVTPYVKIGGKLYKSNRVFGYSGYNWK